MKKGLLIFNTGNGWSGSSSALGTALRALGRGFKVCVIRFSAADLEGESESRSIFPKNLVIEHYDCPFNPVAQSGGQRAMESCKAWRATQNAILSLDYNLVVLDGLHRLLESGSATELDIVNLMKKRPEALHVIVNGDFVEESLIAMADIVTDAHVVKTRPR